LIDISALRQATELASLDQTSAEGTKMKFLRDLCRDKGRLKGEHTSVEAYFLIAILRDDAIVVRERTRGRQSYYELSSPNWVLPVEFLPETQTLAIFRQGSRLIIDKSGRLVAREGFEFSSNGSLLVGRASRVRLGTRYDMNGIAALVDQDPTEQLSFAKGTNTTLLGNLRVQGLTVENGISDTSGRIMAIVPRDTQAYRDGVDRFILAQSQQALSVIFILNDGTALTYTEISKARNLSGPVEATYINKQNVPDRTVIVEVQKPEHDKPIVLARGSVLGLPSSIVFAIAPALDGTDDANTLVAQAQGLEHSGESSMQAVVETLMGRREGVIHAYEGTSNAVPRGTAIPIRPRILEIAKRDIPSAQHLMVLSHILGRGLEKDGLIRRTSHVGSNSITTLLVAAIRDITPTHLTALPGKSEFSVKKVGDNDQLTITTGEVTLLLDVAWRLPGSIMELSKTGALEAYTTGAQAAEAYVEAVHTVAASRLYFLRREVERYHLRDNKFDVRPEQEEIKLIERIQSALAQIPDNRIKELHQQRQGSLTLSDLRELLGPDIAITTDEGRRVLYAISAQLDRQIAISVMLDIFAGTFKPVSTEIPVAEAA